MPQGQRFSLEVILRAMREVDNGVPVPVICRKIGMCEKTFYRYREKVRRNGSHRGSEATRARGGELSRLKKMLSEQMLHNEALRDVLSKNGEARATPAGSLPHAGDLRAQRAQRVPRARDGAGLPPIRGQEERPGRARGADAEPRRHPPSLRLSDARPPSRRRS